MQKVYACHIVAKTSENVIAFKASFLVEAQLFETLGCFLEEHQ